MSHKLARVFVLGSLLAVMGMFIATPSAMAYGNTDQWQVGFSGTCSSQAPSCFGMPPPAIGSTGFWGWCAFGGSNGSADVGTVGSTADCQLTTYFGPASALHISYDIKSWVIQAGSPISLGLPDFLFTSGTFRLNGPGVPAGVPAGVPIPLPTPCPAMLCDTGIPAVPGHFSFHAPGLELNIQVNKIR